MGAMSGANWDQQWDSFTMAKGDPEMDALDRRHTVPELAKIVRQKPEHVYIATRLGKLKHLCKDGVVTVSLREWNDYKAKSHD